jgi:hypothetical protein
MDLTETAEREWVNARARADRTHGRTGLTTAEREELARNEPHVLADQPVALSGLVTYQT